MVRLPFDRIPYYPSSKAGNDKTKKKGSVLEAPLGQRVGCLPFFLRFPTTTRTEEDWGRRPTPAGCDHTLGTIPRILCFSLNGEKVAIWHKGTEGSEGRCADSPILC